MPFIIKGWNSFYEGWLANCLEQSFREGQSDSWKEGWKMGEETGDNKILALREEIILSKEGKARPQSHVIVEEI